MDEEQNTTPHPTRPIGEHKPRMLARRRDVIGQASWSMVGTRAATLDGQTVAAPTGLRNERTTVPPLVAILILSLFVPFHLHVGPILLSATRLVLLLAIVPCICLWLGGRAGRVRTSDLALFGLCAWVAVSLSVVHGSSTALEPAGIFFIETIGAYLVARCYIRDAATFRATVRMFFIAAMLLTPFAIFETLTGKNILLDTANSVLYTVPDVYKEPRWGLDRVQSLFEHPIHFGVVTGAFVALTYYVLGYGRSALTRLWQTALIVLVAFLSLSSGPLAAVLAQLLLIGWDRALNVLRARWHLLFVMTTSTIIVAELASNRSLPNIFLSNFAFNVYTAYNRLHIWEYGTASVAKYPVFGIGFNDWERPHWMTGSMDMFWLLPAVQNGLPAALLLQLAVFAMCVAILCRSMPNAEASACKYGFLICMFGLYMAGWTVHFWKLVYVLFMFLLGSGAWLLDARAVTPSRAQPYPSDAPDQDRPSRRGRTRRLHTANQVRFAGYRHVPVRRRPTTIQ